MHWKCLLRKLHLEAPFTSDVAVTGPHFGWPLTTASSAVTDFRTCPVLSHSSVKIQCLGKEYCMSDWLSYFPFLCLGAQRERERVRGTSFPLSFHGRTWTTLPASVYKFRVLNSSWIINIHLTEKGNYLWQCIWKSEVCCPCYWMV